MLQFQLFLHHMKWIATILIIIFTLVQTVPAIQFFSQDTITGIFNVDEEKEGAEKIDNEEKKHPKDPSDLAFQLSSSSARAIIALHFSERIHTSPFREKPVPPPNFC